METDENKDELNSLDVIKDVNKQADETPKAEQSEKSETENISISELSKTYSEDDFQLALQSEREKVISEYEEAKRIEKLTPDEQLKAQHENSIIKIKELEKRLLQKELKETAINTLNKNGNPVQLAEIIKYDSKDEMLSSLNHTMKTFEQCLAEAIQEKLKGKTPQGLGGSMSTENMLQETIARNIRGGF